MLLTWKDGTFRNIVVLTWLLREFPNHRITKCGNHLSLIAPVCLIRKSSLVKAPVIWGILLTECGSLQTIRVFWVKRFVGVPNFVCLGRIVVWWQNTALSGLGLLCCCLRLPRKTCRVLYEVTPRRSSDNLVLLRATGIYFHFQRDVASSSVLAGVPVCQALHRIYMPWHPEFHRIVSQDYSCYRNTGLIGSGRDYHKLIGRCLFYMGIHNVPVTLWKMSRVRNTEDLQNSVSCVAEVTVRDCSSQACTVQPGKQGFWEGRSWSTYMASVSSQHSCQVQWKQSSPLSYVCYHWGKWSPRVWGERWWNQHRVVNPDFSKTKKFRLSSPQQ